MSEDGYIHITDEVIKNSIQTRKAIFDKNGEVHYDNISAFIKSMRGSDPDATVFYLARALNGGEDPMFLARRIAICAAEDVGMANPNALVVANSAMQAIHMIGMPEARIILSEAAIYVATSKIKRFIFSNKQSIRRCKYKRNRGSTNTYKKYTCTRYAKFWIW